MNIKIDLDVCRVCLKNGTGTSLYDDATLEEKFEFLTQLKCTRGDGLPETLCNKCVGRLHISYDFKRQSIKSADHIQSFLLDVKQKFKLVASVNPGDDDQTDIDYQLIEAVDDVQNEEEVIDEGSAEIVSTKEIKTERPKSRIHVIPNKDIEERQLQLKQDDVSETEERADMVEFEQLQLDSYEDCGYEIEEVVEENNMIAQDLSEENFEEEHLIDEDDDELDDLDLGYVVKSASKPKEKKVHKLHPKLYSSNNSGHICLQCNKDFSTKTNLFRHLETHDGRKPYQCTICGAAFTQNGSLKQHLLIHTGERPYECNICLRGFTQGKSLKFHMRRHTGEKPYSCSECGVSFRQRDGLKRHIFMKHVESRTDEGFECNICKKLHVSKYALKTHMKRHDIKKVFNCTKCDESFASSASLKKHDLSHSGEKIHKCDHCPKSFVHKNSLFAHSKSHMPVKLEKGRAVDEIMKPREYRCKLCDKVFSLRRSLDNHIKLHSIDSILKCVECNIGFTTLRAYKLHRNTQHNEQVDDLNQCEICQLNFTSCYELNVHVLSAHEEKHFRCDACDSVFPTRCDYDEHMMEVHQDDDVAEDEDCENDEDIVNELMPNETIEIRLDSEPEEVIA